MLCSEYQIDKICFLNFADKHKEWHKFADYFNVEIGDYVSFASKTKISIYKIHLKMIPKQK